MTPILPSADAFGAAQIAARQYALIERSRFKVQNQLDAFDRVGLPHHEPFDRSATDVLRAWKRAQANLLRAIVRSWRGCVLSERVDATRGLGEAVYLCLSCLPFPLDAFRSFDGLKRYVGLHPAGAGADRRYSAMLKAWLIHRLAEPPVKVGGLYRAVYDRRKAALLPESAAEDCAICAEAKELRASGKHPLGKAVDCKNLGGVHYKASHAHADALRYTAIAILRDLYNLASGEGANMILPQDGQARCASPPGDSRSAEEGHPSLGAMVPKQETPDSAPPDAADRHPVLAFDTATLRTRKAAPARRGSRVAV